LRVLGSLNRITLFEYFRALFHSDSETVRALKLTLFENIRVLKDYYPI
jgi:hypothetical protein